MTWYKEASKKNGLPSMKNDGWIQKQWIGYLGDTQRYITDPYQCSVYCSETFSKIVVSTSIFKEDNGLVMLQIFWKYGKDERSRAEKTYNKIIEAVTEISEDLAINEGPSAIYECKMRSACFEIDPDRLAKTTIPMINESQKIKYESDWRSSLYGNRYPTHESNGF